MAGDTPLLLTESNLQALINKIRSDYTDPLSYVKECIYSGTSIVPVTIQNHQVSDYEFLILKVGAGAERRFFTLPVNTDTTTIEIIGRNTSSSGLITLSDGVVNISHANVTIDKLSNSVAVVPTTWTSADFKCTLLEVYGMRAVREASSPYFFPTMADIMLAAHPVHSLYISKDPTDPGTLFGGTWTRIKDCMLWAAGDSDTVATNVFTAEGGSKTVSASDLPGHTHGLNSHTHGLNSHTHGLSSGSASSGGSWSFVTPRYLQGSGSGSYSNLVAAVSGVSTTAYYSSSPKEIMGLAETGTPYLTSHSGHTHSLSGSTGAASGNTAAATGSTASNNSNVSTMSIMNPHNKVYVWQRTA